MNLDDLQTEVGTWGQETFPRSTIDSILRHFCEEAIEFAGYDRMVEAISNTTEYCDAPLPTLAMSDAEGPDVLLIMLHYYFRRDKSLLEATLAKFEECKGREWAMHENGYEKHVERTPEASHAS